MHILKHQDIMNNKTDGIAGGSGRVKVWWMHHPLADPWYASWRILGSTINKSLTFMSL